MRCSGDEAARVAEFEHPDDSDKATLRQRELTFANQKAKLGMSIRKKMDKLDLEMFIARCKSDGFSNEAIEALVQQGVHMKQLGENITERVVTGMIGGANVYTEKTYRVEEDINLFDTNNYFDPGHLTRFRKQNNVKEYQATVVGLREHGQWNFVCQRRALMDDGQYVLRDVVDI